MSATGPGDSDWDELWNAFHRVLEADGEEGARALAALPPRLRREVEELLEAHRKSGSWLRVSNTTPVRDALIGGRLGPYRLLRQLGEGGMGCVYLAEQSEPVFRRVALKTVREDWLPKSAGQGRASALRRFEAECQALVLMNHPNVASAYEVGLDVVDGRGVPWVAMEWVSGLPIDEYCDRYRLSSEQRLSILFEVLAGVGHAHRKGIVHRDLKPSNILVTVRDGVAMAKVIDFGIAKALGPALVDSPALTRLGASIGTPGAMSPEQARGEEVEATSDVYSLGLLAYRLLCGVSPAFGAEPGRVPQAPVERFKALAAGDQQDIAARRGERVQDVLERLRRFGPCLLSALDPDPSRRPRDAGALAEALRSADPATGWRRRWPGGWGRAPSRVGAIAIAVAGLVLVAMAFAGHRLLRDATHPTSTSSPMSAAPPPAEAPVRDRRPAVAVTFDDLPSTAELSVGETAALTEGLLSELDRRGIPATGFVNASRLDVAGELDARADILRRWLRAGHGLGNHGARHLSLHGETLPDFLKDIDDGGPVLRRLLSEFEQPLRYYRHPFLQTGRSAETRREVEAHLDAEGYRVAPVTLENHDWMFAEVYAQRLEAGDAPGAADVARAYLEFTVDAFDFWEDASIRLFGHRHAQVLVLHANRLNADHFASVADLLTARGYRFIDLDEAMADPVLGRPDSYTGPGGVLWQFRWAQTLAGVDVDWSAEPEPPAWIVDGFGAPGDFVE